MYKLRLNKNYSVNIFNVLLIVSIFLFVFQSSMETVNSVFSYIDEVISIIGILYLCLIKKNIHLKKYVKVITVLLVIYIFVGLTGNILYQYQPLKAVIIDLFTNIKFFLAIVTGYVICENMSEDKLVKYGLLCAKICTIILFTGYVFDGIFNIWPSEIRYGFKSTKLFFQHPTYLAGILAFLIVLLLVFHKKNNIIFYLLNVIMMTSTLRSKAIVSAVAFIVLYCLVLVIKKQINIRYLFALGVLAVIIAWPMIEFYFIKLSGQSARSVMTNTSLMIMKDYFPIGTGFGTYASSEAAKHYSPVYFLYGIDKHPELGYATREFLSDTFWPIIFAQTGVIGSAIFVIIIGILFFKCWKMQKLFPSIFVADVYSFIYLFISSTAEPAFHNSVSIPLAFMIGISFCYTDKKLRRF